MKEEPTRISPLFGGCFLLCTFMVGVSAVAGFIGNKGQSADSGIVFLLTTAVASGLLGNALWRRGVNPAFGAFFLLCTLAAGVAALVESYGAEGVSGGRVIVSTGLLTAAVAFGLIANAFLRR